VHVRQRAVVHDRWGFAARHPRGLGLTVLFAGVSGTGKTMAAEILAAELDLDLYQVDLATVVSKYIGETEKNLRAIFEGAGQSGAILLFDEADALFGKRSEVRDSHDRYANLEISFLLQQMESYRGVAILTTNMQHAIDPAFLRRIRFIVQFPFPDTAARARIWRGIFPPATPVTGLEYDKLAQLNVAGGTIRNIAANAAFRAADDAAPVGPGHNLAAARTEYAKLEKPLTAAETRGLT
jgi:SpoVK/Ycf46/Vps4 family AAA+-type ATPase